MRTKWFVLGLVALASLAVIVACTAPAVPSPAAATPAATSESVTEGPRRSLIMPLNAEIVKEGPAPAGEPVYGGVLNWGKGLPFHLVASQRLGGSWSEVFGMIYSQLLACPRQDCF